VFRPDLANDLPERRRRGVVVLPNELGPLLQKIKHIHRFYRLRVVLPSLTRLILIFGAVDFPVRKLRPLAGGKAKTGLFCRSFWGVPGVQDHLDTASGQE